MIAIVPGIAAVALLLRLFGVGLTRLPEPGRLLLIIVGFHLAVVTARGTTRAGWSRAARAHAFGAALGAIVLLALAVRIPGYATDLGHVPLDIDEHRLASNVKRYFATGELRHDTVEHYPGLVFWLFAAASFVSYLRGLIGGLTWAAEMLPVETYVQAARMANILVAGATVAVTGAIGRRVGGPAAGLLAAGLVAVVPLSIDTTVLVRNDPGVVLAIVATVLAALKAHAGDGRSWIAIAGALAGSAAAVKYAAVFALVPVLISAAATGTPGIRVRRALVALAAFAAAVMVTNHFVWWDLPNFLRQLSAQVAITGRSHWAATDNPGAFYLLILDRFGPGWWMLLLAGGFTVYGLATRRARLWIVLVFPILYVLFMIQRPSQFPRWVYPVVPFAAVAGSSALVAIVRAAVRLTAARPKTVARTAQALAAALVLLVLWQPVRGGAISFSRRVTPATHTLTEQWLKAHGTAGEVVILGEGWLNLDGSTLVTRRIRDLRAALDEGVASFSGADWLVVPETCFFHPTLKQMGLVHRVQAGQWFAGNQGYDYEVYAIPRLAAAARAE